MKALTYYHSYYRLVERLLRENKKVVFILVISFVCIDILFIKETIDGIIFGTLLAYLIALKILKIRSRITFLVCSALMVSLLTSYIFSFTSVQTEKIGVWLILFLGVGATQQWRE